MDTIPLLSHRSPAAVVAYCESRAVSAQRFLADVARLARLLPDAVHVLNVCADRYRFAVGFAACLVTRRVSLLPSTHTPEVITRLKEFAPDAFCLTDHHSCDIKLRQFRYPEALKLSLDKPAVVAGFEVPLIPAEQLAAIVFTSGSTGIPLPHEKRWGPLARCVASGAAPLGLSDGRAHTLIGTVPSQHMYGFESTVLLALQSGNAFSAERPFYPADIAAAVKRVPQPRVLVTTPVHLRTLLASEIAFPAIERVISATAPLTQELARQVESRYRTALLEIYGSTETGQIALRRSAATAAWSLLPGVRLESSEGHVFADGGHVQQPTLLCDVIEPLGSGEFLLHGRTADSVNVAGKRSSFGYLNALLNAIPGVLDGAFFLNADARGDTGVARLGAAVVAPGLTGATLQELLRQRIDPVFLPRPLLFVERLPRNATGKLPQQALQSLAAEQLRAMDSP
jgi:acyl-coenzyme A synthetase/AMP-(fatty) acid ligase